MNNIKGSRYEYRFFTKLRMNLIQIFTIGDINHSFIFASFCCAITKALMPNKTKDPLSWAYFTYGADEGDRTLE